MPSASIWFCADVWKCVRVNVLRSLAVEAARKCATTCKVQSPLCKYVYGLVSMYGLSFACALVHICISTHTYIHKDFAHNVEATRWQKPTNVNSFLRYYAQAFTTVYYFAFIYICLTTCFILCSAIFRYRLLCLERSDSPLKYQLLSVT